MKKYLMTGMAAIAFCAAFTSCSKEITPMSEEEMVAVGVQKIYSDYEASFQKVFGTPAAGHTWGFSDVAGTRGKDDNSCGSCIKPDMTNFPNYSSQYPNYTTPAPITAAERAYVKDWFEKNWGFTQGQDFKNFYVQQVWGQADKEYTVYYNHYDQNYMNNHPGATSNYYQDDYTDKATMDYLCCGDGTNYSHSLDFNANNDGSGWEMVYMKNSSALSFKYHSSWSSEEFKLFKCAKINVPGVGEGWYVGFCCYGEKYDNGDRKLNYYDKQNEICDDWIVKIVPGDPVPPTGADLRVMAEDLSANDEGKDFDFNDVVFDVYFSPNAGQAYVMVLAAGGTLPLTVHGTEVHGLWGKSTDTMINTHAEDLGLKGVSGLAPKKIQLSGITVNSKEAVESLVKIFVTKEITKADGSIVKEPVELKNTGRAACKVGVAPSHNHANERQNVNETVLGWNEWVVNGGSLGE